MPNRGRLSTSRWMAAAILAVGSVGAPGAQKGPAPASASAQPSYHTFVFTYCLSCHNNRTKAGGLELDAINTAEPGDHWEVWEKVVRKLRGRQMPPPSSRRPDESDRAAALAALEASLDRLSAASPNPGRTDTFRRLNRTEYQNAIRDLLALEFDAASVLPGDSSSYGFDNVTVGNLSPTLLESYVSAAEKISRLAVGGPSLSPGGATVRLRPDLTQEKQIEGLPLGTRGGALVPHTFPVDGEYEMTIRLARDRNEHIEGLTESHQLDLLLDGERLRVFTVEPAKNLEQRELQYRPSQDNLDSHLKIRVPVTAGPHTLGVTFEAKPSVLLETARQPYEAHFNYYRHPPFQPAPYEISILGPYNAMSPGNTPSRQRVFICNPEGLPSGAARGDGAPQAKRVAGGQGPPDQKKEDSCAARILSSLMRRADRRPVTDVDLKTPLRLDPKGKAGGGFEAGVRRGVGAVPLSPELL